MSVILEANQNNADKVFVNGKYNCSFPTGITFNKGDRLTARLCSIDSQKSDTTTIILNEDVNAMITYSYYDCDFDQEDLKRGLAPGDGPGDIEPHVTTYDYFAAYTTGPQFYMLNSVHVSLDVRPLFAGTQDDASNIVVIVYLNYIDEQNQPQKSGNIYTYTANNILIQPEYQPSGFLELQILNPDATILYTDGTLQCFNIFWSVYAQWSGGYIQNGLIGSGSYRPAQNVITPDGEPDPNKNVLRLGHQAVFIPAGRYDPTELAQIITQGLTNPNGIQTVPDGFDQVLIPNNSLLINLQQLNANDGTGNNMVFSQIANTPPDMTAASTTAYKWRDPLPYYFIGASLMAFQYGLTGNIFEWSYGHMPFYNGQAGARNVVIYTVNRADPVGRKYFLLTTSSGVVIHDMTPHNFWSQLGLYNEVQQPIITPLLTDPATGVQFYSKNSWQSPREGTTISFFTPLFNRSPPTPTVANPVYFDTTAVDTAALLGDAITSNVDGGYFLVRAAFNGSTSEYYDNSNIYDNIVSIVSTQYNTANTITGFADSAVVYEHSGAPYIISSVSIDILDPRTKETATGLGSNNTIIFQIDRAPQDITILDDKGKPQIVQVLS